MDLEFDYCIRWLKGGGLGSLVEYHIVPVYRGAQLVPLPLRLRIMPLGPVRLSYFQRGVLYLDHWQE